MKPKQFFNKFFSFIMAFAVLLSSITPFDLKTVEAQSAQVTVKEDTGSFGYQPIGNLTESLLNLSMESGASSKGLEDDLTAKFGARDKIAKNNSGVIINGDVFQERRKDGTGDNAGWKFLCANPLYHSKSPHSNRIIIKANGDLYNPIFSKSNGNSPYEEFLKEYRKYRFPGAASDYGVTESDLLEYNSLAFISGMLYSSLTRGTLSKASLISLIKGAGQDGVVTPKDFQNFDTAVYFSWRFSPDMLLAEKNGYKVYVGNNTDLNKIRAIRKVLEYIHDEAEKGFIILRNPEIRILYNPPSGDSGSMHSTHQILHAFDGEIIVRTLGKFKLDKKVDQNGNPLEGIKFGIYESEDNSGKPLKVFTTDSNGVIEGEWALGDWYLYEEPDQDIDIEDLDTASQKGYKVSIGEENTSVRDNAIPAIVETGGDIVNTVREGKYKLKVIKKDGETSTPLEGATFTLTGVDSDTLGLSATFTTDANGEASVTTTVPGEYELEETSAPDGYVLLESPIKVTITENDTEDNPLVEEVENFKPAPQKGDIVVLKSDSTTNDDLAGAEFALFDENMNELARATTDNYGRAEFLQLDFGKYFVQETKAPAGYQIDDPNPKEVVLAPGGDSALGTIEYAFFTDTPEGEEPVPNIGTKAATAEGLKEFEPGVVDIIDTVSYSNLEPGKTYVLNGQLVDKSNPSNVIATGSKEFTPAASNGTEEVEFKGVDLTQYPGRQFVVFEQLAVKGETEPIATHEDINDDNQTVTVKPEKPTPEQPKIGTSAATVDGEKEFDGGVVTIIDTVKYSGLEDGKEYTLHAKLVNKDDVSDVVAEATQDFTAQGTNGEVDVKFENVDFKGREGQSIVAFERLTEKGGNPDEPITTHEDKNDDDQTVTVNPKGEEPKIGTSAATINGEKEFDGGVVTIIDTVKYSGLEDGKEYTLHAKLVNKDDVSDVVAEATQDFTAQGTNGEVDVKFENVDFKGREGQSIVAFERLTEKGGNPDEPITTHEDKNDDDQTVTVNPKSDEPEIGTKAATIDGAKKFDGGVITIIDTVMYKNLEEGEEYTLHAKLVNKDDVSDVVAEATKDFVAEGKNGSVDVKFEDVDFTGREGQSIVAFERLTKKGGNPDEPITKHEDKDDDDQTVTVNPKSDEPRIGTSASDVVDGGKDALKGEVTIKDIVRYSGLEGGKEYTLRGVLKVKETGETVQNDGKDVVGETTFVADESGNGEVDVMFTFDASNYGGQTLVAFEKLYDKGNEEGEPVATHEDIEDEDQSIDIPDIGTTAVYEANEDKIDKDLTITIKDEVRYTNLIPGKEYTLTGTLADKATGEEIETEDGLITSEVKFTPEEKDGSVMVEFVVPLHVVAGKTTVAFEKLSRDGKELVIHHDINDEEQTVYIPRIGTKATFNNGEKQTEAKGKIQIVDKVMYENLVVGKEYTMRGFLMDKETGKELLDAEGNIIESEAKFTPEEPNGEVSMTFDIDASKLAGKHIVVFETLYDDGKIIATHHDIEDEDQTVVVTKPGETPNPTPTPGPGPKNQYSKTGDDSAAANSKTAIIAILAIAAVAGVIVTLRKKEKLA